MSPIDKSACEESNLLTRRRLLRGGAASIALWGLLPHRSLAASRDPRLLTVVLRGGLDGLAMVAPIGDPSYAGLRGPIAVPASGERAGLALDSPFFALNPNMPFLHTLFQRREALIVHAIATPYRERSHFDGQDVLESGHALPGRIDDGWLNRALLGMGSAESVAPRKGLAMGATVPLVMRGRAPVLSWIPRTYNLPLRESTIARLTDLYNVTDPALAQAFAVGLEIDRAGAGAMGAAAQPAGPRPFAEFVTAADVAARFLAAADGPRVGALSYNGWDTHANEGVLTGQLANRLGGLDAAIRALHDGLGAAWRDTVIVIITEFGRTARVNGTDGTDHGTATTALVIGGSVKGGRVIADWPGLAPAALHEGRDLKATRDLRALLKGTLREHLGVSEQALSSRVFPDSAGVRPLDGIVS